MKKFSSTQQNPILTNVRLWWIKTPKLITSETAKESNSRASVFKNYTRNFSHRWKTQSPASTTVTSLSTTSFTSLHLIKLLCELSLLLLTCAALTSSAWPPRPCSGSDGAAPHCDGAAPRCDRSPGTCHRPGPWVHTSAWWQATASSSHPKLPAVPLSRQAQRNTAWSISGDKEAERSSAGAVQKILYSKWLLEYEEEQTDRFRPPHLFCLGLVASIQEAIATSPSLQSLPFGASNTVPEYKLKLLLNMLLAAKC